MKYSVNVQGTDTVFECDEDVPVLNAMILNRKGPVKHGCCGGGCGVCKAKVVSGDYSAFKPMSAAHVDEADKKAGFVLLCCVKPLSDLVLAVG